MKVEIRKAVSEDRDTMLRILKHWNMHHIPSEEMPELDIAHFYVATVIDMVVGVSGYKLLPGNKGKTTLLAIAPDFQGQGIGKQLQDIRLQAMHQAGARTVTTNCDDLKTITWYKKHYHYREVGVLKKLHAFGSEDVMHWTTLEMDLVSYMANRDEMLARRERYINRNDPPPLSEYAPLIINVCLTGMVPNKALTKHVPVTADEIIEDAVRVHDAGASIVHIHARDSEGKPTSDITQFEKILLGIRRERENLICCVTTSGRNVADVHQRAAVLQLTGDAKPDVASLTLGSLNFTSGASINSIETVEYLAMAMKENSIKPELEVFDSGMINMARYLERHGIISGNKYFNLLLGNLNTAPATLQSLSMLTQSLPENSIWSAAGIGKFQLPMNTTAIAAGGHVRVGIEDSMYYDYNEHTLATNEALVNRVVRISKELQRPIATPAQTRVMLGLDT